ncbi:MAG: DUF6671 family protein [Candidatus Cyclobacteriaceae bacterium M2_1C_046]
MKLFEGRKLLIATKHEKEKAIAPLLTENLGVEVIVSENFDTDTLGTFSGEVERKDNPLNTARKKCIQAMDLYDCDLSIASEGSFGPHPHLLFVPADEEILVFIDRLNDLEIITRTISTETNFAGEEISKEEQLVEFAERAKFPSHALILRSEKSTTKEIVKGITDWELLKESFHRFLKKQGSVYIETDMRAMYNPMRMNVIQEATQKLLEKIKSCCPQCATPGFGVTEVKVGLPCKWCDSPTRSTLSYLYICNKCAFTKEQLHPHGKTSEEPMYCDLCNP